MLLLLFRTWLFGHIFSVFYFSWNVIRACLMEQTGTTIEQFNGIPQDTLFILKSILLNSCIDIILYWRSCNHRNAILLNLKRFLCAWWPFFFFSFFFTIIKDISIIQKLFQELNIFKTEHCSTEIWDASGIKLPK